MTHLKCHKGEAGGGYGHRHGLPGDGDEPQVEQHIAVAAVTGHLLWQALQRRRQAPFLLNRRHAVCTGTASGSYISRQK